MIKGKIPNPKSQIPTWCRFATFFIFFLLAIITWQQNCYSTEARALWITRYQMDSKKKIDNFVNEAKKNGVNMLFVQVLGRGVAYYDSKLMPKQNFGFDPLAYTVEKSHSKGIKIHAWLNAYYVWSNPVPPSDPMHIVNMHPEWIMKGEDGMKFLNPLIPDAADFLFDTYLEVANNYNVDGIHFDYIRFPGIVSGFDADRSYAYGIKYGIDPEELLSSRKFAKARYGNTKYFRLVRDVISYKCYAVTDLVERISLGIKSLGRNIEVSAAVFPDISIAKDDYGQDWSKWLNDGTVDFVVPMIYTEKMQRVHKLISKYNVIDADKRIIIGLGAYKVSSKGIVDQINIYRKLSKNNKSLTGFCLFSYDSIVEKPLYLEKVRKNAFR